MAIIATLSLAVTLAGGGTMVGCGSSSSSGTPTADGGNDSSSGSDAKTDGGQDSSSTPDTSTQDTGVVDTGTPESSLMQAATPTCSPAAGTFTTAQSVTLADTTAGATIFYTEDGTNPNGNSQVFSAPLSVSVTTQVRAFARASGFSDSAVASCEYTINPIVNGVAPPVASPQAGTYNNDFPATLTTTTGGATICFTLDGSTPVCTNGVCVSPSQTYNAQNRIPINGGATEAPPNTGKVTLNAVACEAGMTDGDMAPVDYTLQVAQPSLQGPSPDPTLHDYVKGGTLNPTVASATNGATGLYTTNVGTTVTSTATCTAGTTLGALPSNMIGLPDAKGDQAVSVVGCKPGYLDSAPSTGIYTVTLNAPNVGAGVQPGTYDAVVDVTLDDDTLNGGATGEFACVTTDGVTAPACAAGGCAAGQQKFATGSIAPQILFATDKRTPAGTLPAGDLNVDGTVVQAVACGANFASSLQYTSAPYHEQLDKIAFQCSTVSGVAGFAACTNAVIPNAGKVWVKGSETVVANQETYDFICSSTDGVTAPDCKCDTVAHPTLTKTPATTFTTAGLAAATTVEAVGCLNPTGVGSTGNAALGDVFLQSDAPFASLSIAATGQMQSPTIEQCNAAATPVCSTSAIMNNPQQVEFLNNGANPAYFCYTVNNTAPQDTAAGPKCFAAGSVPGGGGNGSTATYCTTATTAVNAVSTDGPFNPLHPVATNDGPIPTGTWIQAIACDTTSALKPSAGAAPVQFELVVGTPVITTKGGVDFGQGVVITSATAGASIHYATDGTVPDCTAATNSITTGAISSTTGLASVTYWALGAESGALTVIGCKAGFTESPGTDTTTFTYTVAQPGVFYGDQGQLVAASHAATYDDYLVGFAALPLGSGGAGTGGGTFNTWFCTGPNAGCSPLTAGQCTGTGSTPLPATCVVEPADTPLVLTGSTTHSAGQPTGTPLCSAGGLTLPNAVTGLIPNLVACVGPQPTPGPAPAPADQTTTTSAGQSLLFNFQASAPTLTSPAANPASATVTFAGTLTNAAPNGDASSTCGAGNTQPCLGATGGNGGTDPGTSYICASSTGTIASLGGQPASCSGFNSAPPPGWVCQASNSGGFPNAGPTLSIPDQGINATYAVFNCKDGMIWSTASFPVTFGAYVHSPTFTMTGAASDFFANEKLPGAADGATAYVTFDAQNLYVGFDRGAALALTDIVHFYVGSNAGGTSAADSNFVSGKSDLPNTTDTPTLKTDFNGLYHVYWRVDGTLAKTASKWTGAAWADDGNIAAVKYNGAPSTFVEFSVPLSALAGTNNDLHLLGAVWTTGNVQVGAWPAPNPDTNNALTPAWTSWQAELLTDGFSPNDPTLLDHP